ncbi:MAG: S8 family serine peptidase [Firmicutes bacterium]|nr:S8 family serine peptidase [Bacillota bacterium]
MIKKIISAIVLAAAVMLISVLAFAEDMYIVKPKSDMRLFAENEYADLDEFIPELGLYKTDDISELDSDIFEFIEKDAQAELYDTYDYSSIIIKDEYGMTGISNMWDMGIYGTGIRVAVIDSGCNQHTALLNNLCEGADFTDSGDTYDNVGHGTAVCGMIAAEYGFDGLIGIAHKAEIVPLKFMDIDSDGKTVGGYTSQIAEAIVAAVDDFDCNIINMSFGTIDSNTLKAAVDYAYSQNVVMVAAVGNDGSSNACYPASYDNVIGVGSVNEEKGHSDFSNTNDSTNSVFITAPGENMELLYGNDSTKTGSGTSFSASYVSGVIADMMQINSALSPSDIMNILAETAEDLGDEGYDEIFGYGLLRADYIADYMTSQCHYFISEIDVCSADNFIEVRMRVNESASEPTFIFASYKDGVLSQCDLTAENIGNNVLMLRLDENIESSFKYFVWDDLKNLKPLEYVGSN